MFRVTLKRFVNFGILFHFVEVKVSEEPCLKYYTCTLENGCGECGDKPKLTKEKSSSTRLINGKPSAGHQYPWMAQVQTTVATTRGSKPIMGGGAIITFTVIVTAGHVLCIDEYSRKIDGSPELFQVTCPKTPAEKDMNLNRQGLNEVAYSVGHVNRQVIVSNYHKNIVALLYDYEKVSGGNYHDVFSINGDIGIVIDRNGFNLDTNFVSPICLPLSRHDGRDGLVKMAGWGVRLDGKRDPNSGQILKTSCQTNEGRVHGDLTRPIEFWDPKEKGFDKRVQFLDCRVQAQSQKCDKWLLRSKLSTLSTAIDITQIKGTTDAEKLANLKLFKEQKGCEDFFSVAKGKWIQHHQKSSIEFDETVDRIIITGAEGSIILASCYNLRKVAKYGFCETNEPNPRNWGFCSRTCDIGDGTELYGYPYEETYFRYFHDNPYSLRGKYIFWSGQSKPGPLSLENVDFYDSFIYQYILDTHPANTLRVFKCARENLPRALNVFFNKEFGQNNLKYSKSVPEIELSDKMHGHIVSFSGDSGSPLWIEDNGKNYLIAILATGLEDDNEAGGYFSMNRHTCRNAVTKITQEMKKWFFEKHYEY